MTRMQTKYKFAGILLCLVLVTTAVILLNNKKQVETPHGIEDRSSLYEANGQAKRPEQVIDKFFKIKDSPVEASLTAFRIIKSDATYIGVDLKDILKPTDREGENFDPSGHWNVIGDF